MFNAHSDEYGFQPIVVFDDEGRFISAVLRPAKQPGGKEIKPFLRRLFAGADAFSTLLIRVPQSRRSSCRRGPFSGSQLGLLPAHDRGGEDQGGTVVGGAVALALVKQPRLATGGRELHGLLDRVLDIVTLAFKAINLVDDLLWLQLLFEFRRLGRTLAADQVADLSQGEAEFLATQNHLDAHAIGWAIEAGITLARLQKIAGVFVRRADVPSDEVAVAEAHELYLERQLDVDRFEVWDGGRVIVRLPPTPADKLPGTPIRDELTKKFCRAPRLRPSPSGRGSSYRSGAGRERQKDCGLPALPN